MKQFLKSDSALYLGIVLVAAIIVLVFSPNAEQKSRGEVTMEAPVVDRAPQAILSVQVIGIEGVKDKVKMIVVLGTCIKTKVITLKQLSSKDELNKILHGLIDKEMKSGECEDVK